VLALLVGLSWGGAEKRGNLSSNLDDGGGEGYSTISSKFYSNSRSSGHKLSDSLIQGSAKNLGIYLHGITNKELAIHEVKSILDHSSVTQKPLNQTLIAQQVAADISAKVAKYKEILAKSVSAIESLYNIELGPSSSPAVGQEHVVSCCDIPPQQLKFSSTLSVTVNQDLVCDTSPRSGNKPYVESLFQGPTSALSVNLSSIFSPVMGENPGLVWQYWIHESRELLHPAWGSPGRPCSISSIQHNQVYFNTMHSKPKALVLLIDATMTRSLLDLAKTTANNIIDLLLASDRVAVIVVDSAARAFTPFAEESCLTGKLVAASTHAKLRLKAELEAVVGRRTAVNLEAGIREAVNTVRNSDLAVPALILYLTSMTGYPEKDHQNVISSLENLLSVSKNAIFSTIIVADSQVKNLHHLDDRWRKLVPAKMFGALIPVLSNDTVPLVYKDFLVDHKDAAKPSIMHAPVVDQMGRGLLIPFATVVMRAEASLGVHGLDVRAAELLESVSHGQYMEGARMFLINANGDTLVHHLLEPPELRTDANLPLIQTLEVYKGFHSVLQRMKSFPSGSYAIEAGVWYNWQQVDGTDFIVVLASNKNTIEEKMFKCVPLHAEVPDIQFHALIQDGKTKLCKHMREIATMQTAALYLTPAAYALPFQHLIEGGKGMRTKSYMAFLTDTTRLISNPGLRSGVKDDVNLMWHIIKFWKELAYSSPLNNYIVRRRIFSPRGVQISYPGGELDSSINPAKQPAYYKAVKSPNKVIISAPVLDPGGAGYIITVSKAVVFSNGTDEDYLAGVASADFTLGYLYKILNDTVPEGFCSLETSYCFLVDDQGNMIAHPDLVNHVIKKVNVPSENQHFTHMEPVVATYVLKNQDLIVKKVCRSESKVERFFQLETDYASIVSNTDTCKHFKLVVVPGTNLFIGLVNSTCESSAFCWCSTLDQTCLDCMSWEQGECECPCQCEAKTDYCPAYEEGEEEEIPPCEGRELEAEVTRFMVSRHGHYPPCIHTDCSSRVSEQDCYGVLGCSWCQTDRDGQTALSTPACVYQAECFGGILNAPSPYARIYDQSLRLADSDGDRSISRSGPIGPVAGGILAFFLLLALTVWGYKHWSSGGEHGLLSGGGTGSSLRINQLEEEPEDCNSAAPTAGHQNYGLHQGEGNQAISVVSPYRINPSYRRPRPTGTDSDHGYSTMTGCGDQDSEVMSCLGADRSRLRQKHPLSLQSVTSGTSSRTSSPLQGHVELSVMSSDDSGLTKRGCEDEGRRRGAHQKEEKESFPRDEESRFLAPSANLPGVTVLNKNQIIVAATVHMVDD